MVDSVKIRQSLSLLKQSNQQLCSVDEWCDLKYRETTMEKNIVGQNDVLAPVLSQFASSPGMLQEWSSLIFETMPYRVNKTYVLALIDSMNFDTGMHEEPLHEVANCYADIFRTPDLSAAKLEKVRSTIRDYGPLLGLLSRCELEMKACVAKQLQMNEYRRTAHAINKRLDTIMRWLHTTAKQQTEECLRQMVVLAEIRYKQGTNRIPTRKTVERLLNCNSGIAETVATAYELLPKSPFSV